MAIVSFSLTLFFITTLLIHENVIVFPDIFVFGSDFAFVNMHSMLARTHVMHKI